MAESVVSFAVETIGKMLIDEAIFLHGVSDQVEQLQLELSRLQSFLKDADAKQNDDEMVKVWVSQTRDLAYEAEDLIESYAFKFASQEGNILKKCVSFLSKCAVRHSIGAEIQTIKSKISDLTKSFQEYGLEKREGEGSTSSLQQLRRTYSHSVGDDFTGLETDVEMLVSHLVNEDDTPQHRVVSIYGMGGSGKTTLAREIYNHPKMKRYFEGFAWMCISQEWSKRDILQGILTKLIPSQREEIQKWRDEELIRKVYQIQKGNRYLIVLDDIWSIDAWDCIKEAFPIGEDGSKVLLTTRIKEVATQIEPSGFHHPQRLLNDRESWELLKLKIFRQIHDQDPENMSKMEEMGMEMVKHCGGLPLAVVVLGGILATKCNVNEWATVQKNVKAYLGRGKDIEHQGGVHKILELSYNDLPHKLKHCFIYLSRYPEDYDIEVEKLFQLWIAEGMISMKDRIGEETMMDVAGRYLDELVTRSMIQVNVQELMPSIASFKRCRLHDLVRDLSLRKAKEENFFLLVQPREGFDDASYSSTGQIHRLFVHMDENNVAKYIPPPRRATKHLRSLCFSAERYGCRGRIGTLKSQLNWFRMLRVLEIEYLFLNLVFDDEDSFKARLCSLLDHLKLPDAVGNLIHLRYLSLRDSLFLWLPSSIGNLQHLQTLDLRAGIVRIPNVLGKMRQLKNLYLPPVDLDEWFGSKVRLDGLNKLEILEGFDNKMCYAKDLRKLTNLRQLIAKIFVGYEDIMEIATSMSNSYNLQYMKLEVKLPDDDSLIIEKRKEVATKLFFCRNLTELDISNGIGNLSKYEAGLASNLIVLDLKGSEIKDDLMETLERFPNLKSLHLWSDSYSGTEMQCRRTGFPQLRVLWLNGLPNLEKWIVAKGAMPKLSSLHISDCSKLEMIPDGLRFITALEELIVKNMPQEFNRRLQVIDGREGEDFDKIRHVPLVRIE